MMLNCQKHGWIVLLLALVGGSIVYFTLFRNTCKPPPPPSLSQDCILYIGDSISMGIVEALPESLCVVRPAQNCQGTVLGKQCIKTWPDNRHWSLVLVNFGLWDVNHISVAEYVETLEQLLQMIEVASSRVLFVTTTPTQDRRPVAMYNTAMEAHYNVSVCDLYTVIRRTCNATCYADTVHFTAETYASILAPAVTACIHNL